MIGVFDSGVGGLTVVKSIRARMSAVDIVYFGDTARTPYGNKSKGAIEKYVMEDVQFLKDRGAKVIVAACHSASALAHDVLHNVAGVPVFDVIDPSVKAALNATKSGRVGVIGTRATINSGIYQKLLPQNRQIEVFVKSCPLFVPLVEENWIDRPETKTIARAYLQELKLKKIDTLILACTHFPFLRHVIQARMGRHVTLIDPGVEVAQELESFLRAKMPELLNGSGAGDKGVFELHFSDTNPRQEELVRMWLNKLY